MSDELKTLFEEAIREEEESIALFDNLIDIVKNPLFRERLKFIKGEEEKHRAMLWEQFEKSYSGENFTVNPNINLDLDKKTLREMLEFALDHELRSRLIYISMFDAVPEENKELRKFFYYMVRMELTHYQIIEAELECLTRYEECETYFPEIKDVKK